ncbi:MAG: hypothetical protein J6Z41_09755 [Prevotella sp.]|nr:hypothetical protein [Prevotella sp.]
MMKIRIFLTIAAVMATVSVFSQVTDKKDQMLDGPGMVKQVPDRKPPIVYTISEIEEIWGKLPLAVPADYRIPHPRNMAFKKPNIINYALAFCLAYPCDLTKELLRRMNHEIDDMNGYVLSLDHAFIRGVMSTELTPAIQFTYWDLDNNERLFAVAFTGYEEGPGTTADNHVINIGDVQFYKTVIGSDIMTPIEKPFTFDEKELKKYTINLPYKNKDITLVAGYKDRKDVILKYDGKGHFKVKK